MGTAKTYLLLAAALATALLLANVMLHCGITWQHHTPTPLRGRLPRLAA